MKRYEILFVTVIAVFLVWFVVGLVRSLPKRLDPPRRWVTEAAETGTVSRVTSKGIEVRFPRGGKGFFQGEKDFTNGQTVRVEVRVHYVKYYDTPSPPVTEMVFRSVYPAP